MASRSRPSWGGRGCGETINHLTYVNKIQGEHMEELKRWHAAAKKENKEYLEEFGRAFWV